MSSYFDSASQTFQEMRNLGISKFSDEFEKFIQNFTRDILVRATCIEQLKLPSDYISELYEILFEYCFLPWPYNRLPDGPKKEFETEEDELSHIANGIERLHDFFHKVARAGLPGGDSVFVYKTILFEKAEDEFSKSRLQKENLPIIHFSFGDSEESYDVEVFFDKECVGKTKYDIEGCKYFLSINGENLEAFSLVDLEAELLKYLRKNRQNK